MIRVAVAGAAGRMGKANIQAVEAADGMQLGAAIVSPQSSLIGADAGELAGVGKLGVTLSGSLESVINDFDVLIDFTSPQVTLQNMALCAENGKRIVIGTTGLTPEERAELDSYADKMPVVFASNMSVGVNLSFKLLAMAAKVLGDDYDVEIIETHHHHKVDSPSGTALSMGKLLPVRWGVIYVNVRFMAVKVR